MGFGPMDNCRHQPVGAEQYLAVWKKAFWGLWGTFRDLNNGISGGNFKFPLSMLYSKWVGAGR